MSLPKRYVLSGDSTQRPLPIGTLLAFGLLLDRLGADTFWLWVLLAAGILTVIGWFLDYRRNVPIVFDELIK